MHFYEIKDGICFCNRFPEISHSFVPGAMFIVGFAYLEFLVKFGLILTGRCTVFPIFTRVKQSFARYDFGKAGCGNNRFPQSRRVPS